jgi:hypothetical protein
MVTNGKECENLSKLLVAATFEKAKTYVFTEAQIWDREVGGSNPLAPTKRKLGLLDGRRFRWPFLQQPS